MEGPAEGVAAASLGPICSATRNVNGLMWAYRERW